MPGVDRNGMKSIFTPNTRWRVVTEEGFEGGPVIPGDLTPPQNRLPRCSVILPGRASWVTWLPMTGKSAAIIVPLLDINPETGERLDYAELVQETGGDSRPVYAG